MAHIVSTFSTVSPQELCYLRLRAQQLAVPSDKKAALLVQTVAGLQAQELASALLGVRVRSQGITAAEIETARVTDRAIVRTWLQRGTIHLVAAADLGWLLPLFGPVFTAALRPRRTQLGLDDTTCVRVGQLLQEILANQTALTRGELVANLAQRGIPLEGQAVPAVLIYSALQGLICFGLEREGEPTYVLLDDWLPNWRNQVQPEKPYQELVRCYLGAYGPAQPEDCASWSGLSLREIRTAWKALADQLIEITAGSQTLWLLKEQAAWLSQSAPEEPVVRLLPRYDTYLLGYRSRDFIVPAAYSKRVNAGGGIIHPVVLVNGQAVALWKTQKRKAEWLINIESFEPLAGNIKEALETEVRDIGRFLSVNAILQV